MLLTYACCDTRSKFGRGRVQTRLRNTVVKTKMSTMLLASNCTIYSIACLYVCLCNGKQRNLLDIFVVKLERFSRKSLGHLKAMQNDLFIWFASKTRLVQLHKALFICVLVLVLVLVLVCECASVCALCILVYLYISGWCWLVGRLAS